MSGEVTISVEVELGWGFHDLAPPEDVPELSDDGREERAALDELLSLCDEHGIPISFDVVGHLLLDSCDGNHPGPHRDGWFDADPGTDVEADPLFYAPDLVAAIREADVDHELCTHTFSHVLCDEVDPAVLRWELDRVSEVHPEDVVSMVPPRHREPPRDVLRDHGISVLRTPVEERRPEDPIREYAWTLRREHPVTDPVERDGVLETRSSELMTLTATHLSRGVAAPHPAYRVIPERLRMRRQERFLRSGLDRAERQDSSVHYWTHLYNLANDSQWPPIRGLFERISERRSQGLVDVATMRQLRPGD